MLLEELLGEVEVCEPVLLVPLCSPIEPLVLPEVDPAALPLVDPLTPLVLLVLLLG